MTQRVSIEPELFRADSDHPVLLGSRCTSCDESFYPRRWTCPMCLGPVEPVELSSTGRLYSYSFIAMPMFGKATLDAKGYGVGQVDLPEGVRVQTVLEGEPGSWQIGDEMTLVYAPIEVQADEGKELVLYSFAKTEC